LRRSRLQQPSGAPRIASKHGLVPQSTLSRVTAQRQYPSESRLGQTYRFTRQDKPTEHTNWFSLIFYGDLAILATELEKGANVYVEGSFDQRPYVGQDKYKRYIYEVSVHKFFVIGGVAQDQPAPAQPHAALTNEVMTDDSPSLESPETQDTWLI
jgi:single-stranded DNA-binding protein